MLYFIASCHIASVLTPEENVKKVKARRGNKKCPDDTHTMIYNK